MEENKDIQKVFSVEELKIFPGSFVVVCSKRCSGKSLLTRNLIKHLLDIYDYELIIMFSETSQFNDDYSFIDKNLMFKTN